MTLPDSVGDHEAPLACGGLTAYGAVKKLLDHHVLPGRPIAVIGAAGGLGHYAVQIATAFGYKVVGVDIGEERLAFRPGYRTPIFETEFGGLGVMIGWDLAFPEVARGLALDGADLIVAPAAWTSGQMEAWRAYTRARAVANAGYLAAPNRVGNEAR